MGKLLLTIIVAVAVVLGIITFTNQSKPQQPSFTNPFASPTPTPLAIHQNITVPTTTTDNTTLSPTAIIGPMDPQPATRSAVIKTSKGDIYVTLFQKDAPITVKNFIQKATSGFYNGLDFHRVEDWVIQGGDPNGNGTGGNDMPTETNQHEFVTGSLGMAGHEGQNKQIISNDAQFFIVKSDASWLNNQYTNFGIVTSGMDIVNKIQIGDKILGIQLLN